MGDGQGGLDWHDGQPVSRAFGDVYFSRASGMEETRHVFLRQNRLEERWQTPGSGNFTIAETGFGTGLNFLCAWELWQSCAAPHARLHFVSTEQFPLSCDELARALALWPELAPLRDRLLEQYRWLVPGWQRLEFDNGCVALTLLIGDARKTLPELNARVDAWFLDGFAPARNQEMWQPELLSEIARLAAPGCTFATFTSAGAVRRGLEAVGFHVEKVPGFGSKREMLRGIYDFRRSGEGRSPGHLTKHWVPASAETTSKEKHAVVIGGGIAGTSTAYSLARRGWQVTLIERHAGLAQEASGNPQGVLYPRLSGHDIPLSRVALNGYLHTLRLLHRLLPEGNDWDDCGLLQLAFDAREAKRCREVTERGLPGEIVRLVDADEAGLLSGVKLEHGGLWFPAGGWVHPPALCRALAAQSGITAVTSSEALALHRGEHGWQVRAVDTPIAEAPVVVVCAANDSGRFAQTAHLPLESVRGQITQLPATTDSARLKSVICTEGYISPARDGMHCAGATFAPEDRSLQLRAADHAENLAMLASLSPDLYGALGGAALDAGRLQGRVALRCVSPDYLPMAGPMLDAALVEERYSLGSRLSAEHLPWLDGLYVNTGHGSKGLLTAPLCAEIIAALLENEPLPVNAGLARALDPNRFLLRQRGLKRLIGTAVMPEGAIVL